MGAEIQSKAVIRVRDLVTHWSKWFSLYIISGFFWFFIIGASIAWIAGDFYSNLRPLILLSMTGGTLAFATTSASELWENPEAINQLQQLKLTLPQFLMLMVAVGVYSVFIILFSVTLSVLLAVPFGSTALILVIIYPFLDMAIFRRFTLSPAFIPTQALLFVFVVAGVAKESVEEVREVLNYNRSGGFGSGGLGKV